MDNKGYIYMITCKINDKCYIGQTRKFGNNNKKNWYYRSL